MWSVRTCRADVGCLPSRYFLTHWIRGDYTGTFEHGSVRPVWAGFHIREAVVLDQELDLVDLHPSVETFRSRVQVGGEVGAAHEAGAFKGRVPFTASLPELETGPTAPTFSLRV
jgi:hypothetical protein